MNIKERIYEVRQIVERIEETKKERLIFQENDDGKWEYHAPNAQNHTEKQIEEILKHLKMLNTQ